MVGWKGNERDCCWYTSGDGCGFGLRERRGVVTWVLVLWCRDARVDHFSLSKDGDIC